MPLNSVPGSASTSVVKSITDPSSLGLCPCWWRCPTELALQRCYPLCYVSKLRPSVSARVRGPAKAASVVCNVSQARRRP